MNIDDELNVADELSANENPIVENKAPEPELSLRDELKKAIAETSAPAGERPRDEAGRFAGQKPTEQPAAGQQQATAAPLDPQAAQVETPVVRAPVSWSPDAKAAFDQLPPNVQAAVSKREAEIENGFKILQDYKGLDEFTPIIKQAGTTHADVMKRAIEWEKGLKIDSINTIMHAAKIAGVDLRQVFGGQQPQQPQQPQFDPRIVDQAVERKLREQEAIRTTEAFVKDPAKPHAAKVVEDMALLISNGRANDLDTAYEMAIWANPEIRAELIKQQTAQAVPQKQVTDAADQARRASKSITGTSSAGSSRRATQTGELSLREELEQAMRASAGAV